MRWNVYFCIYSLAVASQSLSPPVTPARCLTDISPSSCVPLDAGSPCLGTNVSFTHTSFVYTGLTNTTHTQRVLELWKGLRFVPECWAVVQPFLCSVYLPKCDNATGKVQRPSKEACVRIHDACRIVAMTRDWPAMLHCYEKHFAAKCQTDYDAHVFNRTHSCPAPLVATDVKHNWYEAVPGCGIPWRNPLYTDTEHRWVHIIIAVLAAVSLFASLFTVLTYVIDWHNSKRYPAVILFYLNVCFFLATLGWLIQFVGDARRKIVGRRDGTARSDEPSLGAGESVSCTLIFVLIYYPTIAGCVWFVMLTYTRHVSFLTLGTPRDHLRGKVAYLHIVSWCTPLVLTVISLIAAKIDGDSLTGVCFISERDVAARICLLIMPLIIFFIASLNYLVKSLHTLVEIRKDTPVTLISHKALAKIREATLRIGIFTCLSITFMVISLSIHIYSFTCRPEWEESLKRHIICRAMVETGNSNASISACDMKSRPSAAITALHAATYFLLTVAMSSWSWTRSSLQSWERFLRRLLHKPSDRPVRLKKHHMIARAFEKRKRRGNKGGRISISFCSTHDDPLGMKIELQSGSSHDISSFAAAMPMLMHRRGGMVVPIAGSHRRHSDSDIGSVASRMSRRPSVNSQLNAPCVNPAVSDHDRRQPRSNRANRRVEPVILTLPNNARLARLSRGRGNSSSDDSETSAREIDVRTSHERELSRPLSRASARTASLNDLPHTLADPPPPANLTDFAIFTASGLRARTIEFRRLGSDAPCITFELPRRSSGDLFTRTTPADYATPGVTDTLSHSQDLSDVTVTDLT